MQVVVFVHFPPEHRQGLHRKMIDALKPGGLLIMQAFRKEQLNYKSGGPPVEEMLYDEAMLRDDFSTGRITHLVSHNVHLQEGAYHHGEGAVLDLIVEKA